MKNLLCNPIYVLFILSSVIHLNSIVIIVTFMPKYLEQQYGKSTAEIIFLIGMYFYYLISSSSPFSRSMMNSIP